MGLIAKVRMGTALAWAGEGKHVRALPRRGDGDFKLQRTAIPQISSGTSHRKATLRVSTTGLAHLKPLAGSEPRPLAKDCSQLRRHAEAIAGSFINLRRLCNAWLTLFQCSLVLPS